jgi:outer membrane protein OmpA-like peptidoglycan-associated protein
MINLMINLAKRFSSIVLLSSVLSSIMISSGCHHKSAPKQDLSGKSVSIRQMITDAGGIIITQGSRLQIILPTDEFFEAQSTEIIEEQLDTLELVSLYLKSFLKTHPAQQHVYVTAYTDTVYTPKQRQALSEQYAQVVASYLWSQGFSHRLLSVAGYGAKFSIADQTTAAGSHANRRVQIDVLPR